ncbi:uncharacterized protein N7483_000165 [Penicillium malachiteum]|uniref:uncharacterized protein n=1 Tax=Penicillium malachiteum TaxID=1324776 RepID=UPI002547F6E1|nr:uncharacterized protein N7483_000165 [Penicillium malachiteum]KAJ5735040.1 hypothetical protein N7483_000165 [Penicillium malachiteum]
MDDNPNRNYLLATNLFHTFPGYSTKVTKTQNTAAARPAQPPPTKTTHNAPKINKRPRITSNDMIPEKDDRPEKQEKGGGKDEKPGPVDLWKEAFDKLDPSSQAYLSTDDIPAIVAIDHVIQDNTAKYKEWKTGGLKIRRKDADDINIRDSVDKIISAAQRARDVISTFASFDPTGHASSAWTVISFGMSIVQNRSDRRDAIFDASDYLAEPTAQSVSNLRKEYHLQGSQLDSKALKSVLENVLSKIPGQVYLVFDALDECPEDSQVKERRSLLSFLAGLLERYKDKVHILATSRPERNIERALGKFPRIDPESCLGNDKSIIDTLLSQRERRFRWAELQIIELEGCNNPEEIHHALKTIPHSLKEIHRRVLDRIKPKDVPIARRIFALISFSPVALHLDMVAAMLIITVSAILKICTTSLVNVFEGKVQFAHSSVQEFMIVSESDEGVLPAHHHPCQFKISSGKLYLVEKIADLLLGQTEELKIELKIHRLFTTPTVYFNWIRAAYRDDDDHWRNPWIKPLKECPAPLHKASYLGLLKTVEVLVSQGADPATYSKLPERGMLESSISVAASLGHLDIVQFFLQKGSMQRRDVWWFFAYLDHRKADKAKLETILRTLWDQGLPCGESPDRCNKFDEELLEWTMTRRSDSEVEILGILLDWRPEVDVPITDDFIARQIVNGHASKECFRLLFKRCDIYVPNIPESTIKKHCDCYIGLYSGFAYLAEDWPNELQIEYTTSSLWESETLVKTICDHADAANMLKLLTQIDGFCIPITEDIVCSAAKNENGDLVVHWLAQTHRSRLPVTEKALLSAIQNLDTGVEVLRILMQDFPSALWTDALFEGACENKDALVFLLDQHPKDLPIEKMLEAVEYASDVRESRDALRVLLERGILKADEKLIETLAPSPSLLVCMLVFNPDVDITHEALLSAAYNSSSMRLIFEARENSLPITEDVLIAAIEAQSDKEMFELLLKKQGSLPLAAKVLDTALEYRPTGACFFQVLPDSDIRKLWQPSWCDTELPMRDRTESLIRVLRIEGSKMTDQILEEFPYGPEDQGKSEFDEFIEMMWTERALPALLSGTERAAEIILERCGNQAIELFFQCGEYQGPITDDLIQAAGRNEIADGGKLMSFLEQKKSEILYAGY